VSLEVVARLPGGDEDCIKQLMDLHVPRLGLMEDIVDIVHRSLEGLDPLGGGGDPVRPFPLVRAQGAPDPLGSEGPLKSRTPRLFGHEGLKRPPGVGTRRLRGMARSLGGGTRLPPQSLVPQRFRVLRP
jgi:hypothetical protein